MALVVAGFRMSGGEVEFIAELTAANFEGALMAGFIDDLWLYGWDVLRGLVRKGTVAHVATGLPHPTLSADDRQTLHDSAEQRDVLVVEALTWAVPKFVQLVKEGHWSPEKGASLASYFTGTCATGFWLAYARWRRERSLTILVMERLNALPECYASDAARDVSNRNAIQIIMRTASPEQRAICLGILQDKTHSEIGYELGLSARAVEGRMYQLRTRAWELVGRGKVDPSLVPGSRAASRIAKGNQ